MTVKMILSIHLANQANYNSEWPAFQLGWLAQCSGGFRPSDKKGEGPVIQTLR